MNSQFVTGTLKNIKNMVTVFLIGGIWLWSSSIKAETVSSPEYTAQQLEGILVRNGAEGSDGIGKQATNLGSEFIIARPSEQTTKTIFAGYSGSVIELSDYSRSDWKIHSASQDWLNLNRGDGSKDIVRIIFLRF